MSRLQNLVNSLINVIVDYYSSQTYKKLSLDNLLKLSHTDLEKELKDIIDASIKGKGYDRRRPLLEYFLYEITSLKPLVDNPEPLGEIKAQYVHNNLVKLIEITRKLLGMQKNINISVKYNHKTVELMGSKSCQSGRSLKLWLTDYNIFPKDDFDSKSFITTIISEHQALLAQPILIRMVKESEEEKAILQEQNKDLHAKIERLEQEKALLQEENTVLKEKSSLLEDSRDNLKIQLELQKNKHNKTSEELGRLLENQGNPKLYPTPGSALLGISLSSQGTVKYPAPSFFSQLTSSQSSHPSN